MARAPRGAGMRRSGPLACPSSAPQKQGPQEGLRVEGASLSLACPLEVARASAQRRSRVLATPGLRPSPGPPSSPAAPRSAVGGTGSTRGRYYFGADAARPA
jgi:hypothetical protein